MTRRRFFTQVAEAAGVLALAASPGKPKQTRHVVRFNPNDKRNRISISSWSFHNHFSSTRPKELGRLTSSLVLLDFPQMIADRYQVHNLEFVAPHFASKEPTYIQELKLKLHDAHSRLVNIPVDIPEIWNQGGLSDPDEEVRNTAINGAKTWIDIASTLGAQSVRCDPGKMMNPEDLSLTIDSYRKLASYGASKRIVVIIENHGKIGSEHPEALVDIFREVGGSFIGALPDFGNFPDEESRLRGLAMLFRYAKTVCHAKGLEFDSSGNETRFEFDRCMEISKQANFKGVYSIEYEGPGDSYEGIEKVVNELLRYL